MKCKHVIGVFADYDGACHLETTEDRKNFNEAPGQIDFKYCPNCGAENENN